MDPIWAKRQENWRRFSDWEAAQLAQLPEDFSAALRWMSGARELTRRFDLEWDSRESMEEHWQHLALVHALLRRIAE